MPRSIHRCPNCNEPVSQFAAGCAVCGTDLKAARSELAARRARMPSVSAPRLSDDVIRIGVTVLGVLFAPLLGLLLALWFAYDSNRDGRLTTRNLMIALAVLAVVLIFAPVWIWGGIVAGL